LASLGQDLQTEYVPAHLLGDNEPRTEACKRITHEIARLRELLDKETNQSCWVSNVIIETARAIRPGYSCLHVYDR
jgi:hypothetical protein